MFDRKNPVWVSRIRPTAIMTKVPMKVRPKFPEPQKRGVVGALAVDEVLAEMARPKSSPGLQARLYQAGEIGKENAIKWISCGIIWRREGKEAPFDGWRRHAKAVEDALDRFCVGRGGHYAV